MFLLYDGRARHCDTEDEAAILVAAETIEEARRLSASFQGTDAIWFEYKRTGCVLHEGRRRRDIGQFLLQTSKAVGA